MRLCFLFAINAFICGKSFRFVIDAFGLKLLFFVKSIITFLPQQGSSILNPRLYPLSFYLLIRFFLICFFFIRFAWKVPASSSALPGKRLLLYPLCRAVSIKFDGRRVDFINLPLLCFG
jgi:hypothetical protein